MAARRISAVVLCAAALGLAACGGGGAAVQMTAASTQITVLAAASLSQSFDAAGAAVLGPDRITVSYSFAGSQQLVQNIIDGAPADVIATADTATMQRLVAARLVMTPETFVRNRLEIAVAPHNPKHITSLADLARSDVTVVLAASTVPAGHYALVALHNAGVTVHPVSLELDVEAALEKVESGDADAAIVYETDVAGAGGAVVGVAIPAQDNVIATYPVAVLRGTTHMRAAQAFVASCVSGSMQRDLERHGFLPP